MLFFQSPLVQAIFSRHVEEVEFLLNNNEDASSLVILSHYHVTTNQNGELSSDTNMYIGHSCSLRCYHCLFLAKCIGSLVEHCFLLQDQEQSTPLHAASFLGDVDIMELLLASGRETNSGYHIGILLKKQPDRVYVYKHGINLIMPLERGEE